MHTDWVRFITDGSCGWPTVTPQPAGAEAYNEYPTTTRPRTGWRSSQVALGQLDTATVRQWRAGLLEAGVSATMVAKLYRLLRAILNTPVTEDELIIVNPCRKARARNGPPNGRC